MTDIIEGESESLRLTVGRLKARVAVLEACLREVELFLALGEHVDCEPTWDCAPMHRAIAAALASPPDEGGAHDGQGLASDSEPLGPWTDADAEFTRREVAQNVSGRPRCPACHHANHDDGPVCSSCGCEAL